MDESKKETADTVARHQADYSSKWDMSMLLVPPTAAAGPGVLFLCFLFILALCFPAIFLLLLKKKYFHVLSL